MHHIIGIYSRLTRGTFFFFKGQLILWIEITVKEGNLSEMGLEKRNKKAEGKWSRSE